MMFQFTFHDREEALCAIVPNVDDRTIVLENFRVVSVDDGTLSIPDPVPTLSTLRLEKGTPVTIVSKQSHGTAVMLGAHNTLLQMEGTDGKCELVANTDLTYRMGTTIDKTLPPYRVVDGYLVPVEDPTCETEDVVEAEVVEEVVKDGVTMDSISTPLTDASYGAWKGKYLSDVVSFAPDELLRTPNVRTLHSNFIVDGDFIYENEQGYRRLNRVVDTTNVFSNLASTLDIRQVKAGIVIPLLAHGGTRTTVTAGIGTHFLIHSAVHFTCTVLTVQDMDDWSRETLEDMRKKYMPCTTVTKVCDATGEEGEEEEGGVEVVDVEEQGGVEVVDLDEEDRREDVVDHPPPCLHNMYVVVRVKPPVRGGRRPFQACTHPGCSKGLHHSGICDVIIGETRKRSATDHYTPATCSDVVSIDDSDDDDSDDDSDDDPPHSRWNIQCPAAKRRKPIDTMVGIHEHHFPEGFRVAVKERVDALARGTVDSNGQRSFPCVTLQSNGGYYSQTVMGRCGRNRYLGVFRRSTVGAFAVVMARLFPGTFDSMSPTATMRHWMEMMVNDEDVSDEWTARVRRAGCRSTERIRIDEDE